MKKIYRKRNYVLAAVMAGCVLVAGGCQGNVKKNPGKNASETKAEKQEKTEQEKQKISVKEGYLLNQPKNIHVATDGTRAFCMGDRGIYEITGGSFKRIYEGVGIKGISLWQDRIYFIQHDTQAGTSRLYRMGLDGSAPELLKEDARIEGWVRIYDNVLYYMGTDMQVGGIMLDADGMPGEEKSPEAEDFPYKDQNDFSAGLTNSGKDAWDPAYSLAFYGGTFEYRSQNELSRRVVFVSEGKETGVVRNVKGEALIAGNGIYYTKPEGDGIYCTSLNAITEKLVCPYAGNVGFLNFDESCIYYADGEIQDPILRKVYQTNVQSGETREIFEAVLGNTGYGSPFDIAGDFVLYRDAVNGMLLLRQISQPENIVPEP